MLSRERRRFADYLSRRRGLFALCALLCCVCYAHNAFSLNVRVDCEGFINEPGTLQGWMYIGRFGQAVLKPLLGNLRYNPYYSGLLFIAFFGYYPILQETFRRIRPPVLSWAVRFAIFNAAVVAAYWVIVHVFGITEILEEFGSFGQLFWFIRAIKCGYRIGSMLNSLWIERILYPKSAI